MWIPLKRFKKKFLCTLSQTKYLAAGMVHINLKESFVNCWTAFNVKLLKTLHRPVLSPICTDEMNILILFA